MPHISDPKFYNLVQELNKRIKLVQSIPEKWHGELDETEKLIPVNVIEERNLDKKDLKDDIRIRKAKTEIAPISLLVLIANEIAGGLESAGVAKLRDWVEKLENIHWRVKRKLEGKYFDPISEEISTNVVAKTFDTQTVGFGVGGFIDGDNEKPEPVPDEEEETEETEEESEESTEEAEGQSETTGDKPTIIYWTQPQVYRRSVMLKVRDDYFHDEEYDKLNELFVLQNLNYPEPERKQVAVINGTKLCGIPFRECVYNKLILLLEDAIRLINYLYPVTKNGIVAEIIGCDLIDANGPCCTPEMCIGEENCCKWRYGTDFVNIGPVPRINTELEIGRPNVYINLRGDKAPQVAFRINNGVLCPCIS